MKDHETLRTPVSSEPIASKAPVDRSIELELEQPGHSSATVAVVEAPVSEEGKSMSEEARKDEEEREKLTSVGDRDGLAAVPS